MTIYLFPLMIHVLIFIKRIKQGVLFSFFNSSFLSFSFIFHRIKQNMLFILPKDLTFVTVMVVSRLPFINALIFLLFICLISESRILFLQYYLILKFIK